MPTKLSVLCSQRRPLSFKTHLALPTRRTPASPAGDNQFVVDAYAGVFGHAAAGQAQVQPFIGQLNFLENLYAAAGVFGSASNIDLLARGAVYGQMLGIAHEIDPTAFGALAGDYYGYAYIDRCGPRLPYAGTISRPPYLPPLMTRQ